MTYNNPQHNTNKYSCTPFPILKEGDTSGIVTYLDLVDLGSISGFGVNLTEIGGTQRWDNTIITNWQTLFNAINEHLTIFNARLQELEQSVNPDAITIISKSNNQLEANVNNVTWSSSSPQIIVNPTIGQTTTYSLASSATSYGSFTLTTNRELIEEGESITITAQWTGKTTTYDAIITATKSGMTSATKQVQLPKEAICPASVTLDNGKAIALNSSGRGTLTYTPSVGNYTVKTQGNETQGSCSFTVAASQPTTTYYWYVGTTLPTAANLLSIATGSATSKPDWSTPYSIAATNNTGESSYMYYCFPAEWNVIVLDSDRATEVALAQEGTITVNNITYNIQRTGRKISNGTSKDYYAIFNNGDAITITSKSGNQLEANVDNVSWSSDSSHINVNPKTGQTTTYSLSSSATSYGSFTLTASESSIQEGESITITAQWYNHTTPYSATITATKAGMKSATKQVQLSKEATCPAYVRLDNGETITLNSSGYGTYTYMPTVGNYTITTQGNETAGSCSFTVIEATPDAITITSKSGNQLEANVDNVSWSSDSSYINVSPKTGQTTTYSLSSSATSYGSFTLTTDKSSIEEGESITITAQWYNHTTPYSATITAAKSGMTSATKQVTLYKEATRPSAVTLDNGGTLSLATISLDSNGRGTYTYTPTVGNYTITTQGNETSGSCSFTVTEATPDVEPVNADIVAVYNPSDISKPTKLLDNGSSFKAMEIDGVVQSSVVTSYKFDRNGIHTIKYELNGSEIGDGAFDGCRDLRSIDILNSVTSIGANAFDTCTGLASCTIGDSVTTIGDTAFNCCSDLSSINIPNSVTSIGNTAFAVCDELTSIDIPNSVTSIGEYAFQDCSNLTSVTLSNRLTKISNSAFEGCSSLTSIDIPDSVTSIDGWAFNGCSGLTSVTIGNGVTSIGNDAFYGCSGLTSIDIPDNVTSIGEYAFQNCTSLTSIVSNAMTAPTISNNTFRNVKTGGTLTVSYYSSDYNDIWLSTSTYYLGYYDWNIEYYDEPDVEPVNADIVAVYNIQDTSKSTKLLNNESSFKAMEIDGVVQPSVVTSYKFDRYGIHTIKYELNGSRIGDGAFESCSRLTSIDILDSVTIIDNDAFEGCDGLTSCTIGDNVTSIADNAFQSCSSLTSIDIGNSVTSIGSNAFDSCVNLTSIDMPNSVTSIDGWAFYNCTSLTSVTLSNRLTEIGEDAFYGCSDLTSIDIPDSVTSIGGYTFYECSNLTSVTLSNNLTEISDGIFSDCSSLTSINIPNGVTSIGGDAFQGCSGLTSINIPNGVTSIGGDAFYGCSGLTSITSNATTAPTISNNTFQNVKRSGTLTVPYGSSGYDTWLSTSTYYLGYYDWNIEYDGAPETITITSKSGNQLEANVDNVSWSSDSSHINVNPKTGQTTTYSLSSSATSYGSFTLTASESSIQEGESITITAQWYNHTTPYSATITATKAGMGSAAKLVTLFKEATCPAYVDLDNGARITLNSSGYGTYTYTPTVGSYTITTQGNETQGSCSFTVVAAVNVNADLIAYYNVQNISSPTVICINNGNSFKSMEIDGVNSMNITTQGEIKYQFNTTGSHTIKYELNDSSIGNGAFSPCGTLTSIDILDSVTSIGDGTFAGRSTLTSIDIPDSVTSIGSNAFSGCSGLTSVTIGNGVTSIGNTAFGGCSNLTSIDIPESVTSIGASAFAACSRLISITSNAMTPPTITNNTFQGVKTGGTLTVPYGSDNFSYYKWLSSDSYYLGYYGWNIEYYGVPNVEPINEDIVAYYNIQDTSSPTTICDNRGNKFKSMEIDGVVQSSVVSSYQFNTTGTHTIKYELNDSNIANGAFSTCTSLTSCTIADSVTSIGMGAFAGCSGLTSIDIPDSVTSIGTNAFSGCSSLTSIVCNAMTAPNISSSTFASIATDGTLTVPTGSSGYDGWMITDNYYLGKYGWHVEPM